MLTSSAFNGVHKENYFNFQHFRLKSISRKKNYIAIPAIPIETNFDEDEVTHLTWHFFDNMGIETSNAPCLLTYEDFCKGSTIIPFDLTADRCALFHNHLTNSVFCILYSVFQEVTHVHRTESRGKGPSI